MQKGSGQENVHTIIVYTGISVGMCRGWGEGVGKNDLVNNLGGVGDLFLVVMLCYLSGCGLCWCIQSGLSVLG